MRSRLGGERRVVDDHREMKYAAKRLIACADFGERRATSRSEPTSAETTLDLRPRVCGGSSTKASASGVAAPAATD